MHRARLTAPVLLIALSAAARADEPKVTLLAGFEKEQLRVWGLKVEGDTVPFARRAVCRPGDATQGEFALVRTLTPQNVDWGGLKGETEEWLRYYHGIVLNATGRFRSQRGRPAWFPVNWSGHERLRLDVKTTKAALRFRVMLEDELVSPPTTRVFAIKPGGWVTLDIDLAEAGTLRDLEPPAKTTGPARVKVRTLNIYVAFRGKVYRLGAEAWTEDSPPRTGAHKLIAAGEVVHCVGKTVKIEGDQQVTAIWHSRKPPGAAWSAVSVLAEERTQKSRFGAIAIIAPQEAFGNVIPVAYGPHARWIKILRIPVGG